MPEGFLFDTVTCSRWRRGDRLLRRRIEALPVDAALYTSVMSVGELSFGIHNAPYEYQERLWQQTREILARFQSILEVTREVADRYGTLVAQVPPGQHIGQNDYWIAANALTHNLARCDLVSTKCTLISPQPFVVWQTKRRRGLRLSGRVGVVRAHRGSTPASGLGLADDTLPQWF